MKFLHTSALMLSVLVMSLASSARASAPQVKTQAPGFHRTMVGEYEITTLFDGFFPMNVKEFLTRVPEAKLKADLADAHQGEVIPTSVNAFLINTGSRLILVDAGCGAFFGPSFGHIADHLKAAGYAADQVDEIVITHMHTDHLGGVVGEAKAAFPNATLRMDQKDADYWLNADHAKTITNPMMKGMFANAIAAVAPYQAAGHFKPFQGKTELAPGVTALPTYGHTPGHTAYAVESNGQKLLLVGDLFHVEAVEFPDPSAGFIGDFDQKIASAERKKIFAEAAEKGYLIGAAHLPFPGIGHVTKVKAGAYRYVPAPYAPVELPKQTADASTAKK